MYNREQYDGLYGAMRIDKVKFYTLIYIDLIILLKVQQLQYDINEYVFLMENRYKNIYHQQ